MSKAISKPIPFFENHERFLKFISVNQKSKCWEWVGAKRKSFSGYGSFSIGHYNNFSAHRVSYSIFKGAMDESMVIDHICRNTSCVNPDHLREVDRRTNVIENNSSTAFFNFRKTHCVWGHEFTFENIYLYKGKRHCVACRKDRNKESRGRKKEKLFGASDE